MNWPFKKQNQYIRIQDGIKKVPTIQKQNHSPTKQLWTVGNLNMLGTRAPTVFKKVIYVANKREVLSAVRALEHVLTVEQNLTQSEKNWDWSFVFNNWKPDKNMKNCSIYSWYANTKFWRSGVPIQSSKPNWISNLWYQSQSKVIAQMPNINPVQIWSNTTLLTQILLRVVTIFPKVWINLCMHQINLY